MIYEYSQTRLIDTKDYNDILVSIKDVNSSYTEFIFKDEDKQKDFYETVKSWDLFGNNTFFKEDNKLVYLCSQKGASAYEYSKFMELMICYFNNDFNKK